MKTGLVSQIEFETQFLEMLRAEKLLETDVEKIKNLESDTQSKGFSG